MKFEWTEECAWTAVVLFLMLAATTMVVSCQRTNTDLEIARMRYHYKQVTLPSQTESAPTWVPATVDSAR